MQTPLTKRASRGRFETLERRCLLSISFDLDGDGYVGPGDGAIFGQAWHSEGGYVFSDSSAPPPDTVNWNSLCDFDGDFHIGSGDYSWLSTNWGLKETDPLRFPRDPHENDQNAAEAYAQGALPQRTWFSQQYQAMAVADDDDWFRIDVPAGQPLVAVDCRFAHDQGNLDVELHDHQGAIATAESTTDNESILFAVNKPGTYYIRVHSPEAPTGQRYDLWWEATPIPDDHEEDDTVAQSEFLGVFAQERWYSDVYGYKSVQADDDYFAVNLRSDQRYLTIDATFSHAQGDVSMYLWSESLAQIIAGSTTTTDNEHIEINLDDSGYPSGRYCVKIVGPNSGQLYDFRWDAQRLDFRAVDDTATVDEDSIDNRIDVLQNDVGTDLVIVDASPGWTDGRHLFYSPHQDFFGATYVNYTIQQDSGGPTDSGQVLVTINPLPDYPVAVDDYASVDEDSVDNQIDVLANDYDPDGDSPVVLSATVTSASPLGSVWRDGDYVYYTPDLDANGTETIQYNIQDGTGRKDSATITVTVGQSPDAPIAEDDFFSFVTGMHKNTLHVTGNDHDPDGDPFEIVGFPVLPTSGDVTTDGVIVEYQPDEGFIGFDSFAYTIEDSTGRTATATVDVHVLPTSDIHEEDDNLAQAAALGVAPNFVAPCHLLDEDYFMVELLPGAAEQFAAEIWFGHAWGNMELELLDSTGAVVVGSYSTTDDEHVSAAAPDISPGTYYLRVFQSGGAYYGQSYVILWDSFGSADPHEPDNSLFLADALGPLVADAPVAGVSNDADYYRFEVQPGMGYITTECTYTRAEGNLDLELYDVYGALRAGSYSNYYGSDQIFKTLPAGVYYLRVFNADPYTGQEYQLSWNQAPTEDPHEEDDGIAQADARGLFWSDYFFREQYGREATQTDDDYYRIDARSGYLELDVDCFFTDGEGNIQLYLLDSVGSVVASATSSTDHEHIDYVAPAPGAYYIKVTTSGAISGLQTYELLWRENKHDDSHEDDDDNSEAAEKGPFAPDTWHTGALWNVDVYAIDVPLGYSRVQVDCRFTHADGNIDVNVNGLPVSGTSTTNNEWLDFTVNSPGLYYVRVHTPDEYVGQAYELSWTAIATDDSHEPDGSRQQADAKGPFAQNADFHGQQWNDDIYRIEVAQGYEHVTVDCTFDGGEGDIDIQLADAAGYPVDVSLGLSDGEHIDTVVPAAGAYYIYVYNGAGGLGTGQQYELTWSASAADDTHENDNSFDLADLRGNFAQGAWFNGRVWNEDYFRINVPAGCRRLEIACLFDHPDGNVNIALFDADKNVLGFSNSRTSTR